MNEAKCVYCGLPVVPFDDENATYIAKCKHFYHQRCLAALMRGKKERNNRNQVIAPCVSHGCHQWISMSDVALIRRPQRDESANQYRIYPEDYELRSNLRKKDDEMALYKHQMALMAVENREMRTRYKLAIERTHIPETHTQRNPATLFKPNSNMTNDFRPVSPQRYPAPKFPTYFPVRTHTSLHVERTSNGQPIFVQSSRFRPETVITEINTRTGTISYRQCPVRSSNGEHEGRFSNDHFSSTARNNVNGDVQSQLTNHRSRTNTTNHRYDTRNALQPSTEPRFPMKGPSPKPVTEYDPKTRLPIQVRGTSADKGDYHQRYWKRWHTNSSEIQPFYPLNSYPRYFTAAGYAHAPGVYRSVYLVFNILMVGDGHIEAIATILERRRPFAGILDRDMYRRDLTIADITAYLGSWTVLPSRIMISFGHADIIRRTNQDELKETLRLLGIILNNANVREAHLVPIIPHPSLDTRTFDRINLALEHHWVENFDGIVIKLDSTFAELHAKPAHFDEFGPYYDDEEYSPIISALKERLIPELKKKVKDPVTTPMEEGEQNNAINEIVQRFRNTQPQPSSSKTTETTSQSSSTSTIPTAENKNEYVPSTSSNFSQTNSESPSSTSTANSATNTNASTSSDIVQPSSTSTVTPNENVPDSVVSTSSISTNPNNEQSSSTSTTTPTTTSAIKPSTEKMETNESNELNSTTVQNGESNQSSTTTSISSKNTTLNNSKVMKIRRRNAALDAVQREHDKLAAKKATDKRKLEQKHVEAKMTKFAIDSPAHENENSPVKSHENTPTEEPTNPFPFLEDTVFIKCENNDTGSGNDQFLEETVKEEEDEDEDRLNQYYAGTAVEYFSDEDENNDEDRYSDEHLGDNNYM